MNKTVISANEERFRAMVTASSDMVYILNGDWQTLYLLEGRGLLPDVDQPLTHWISNYIHPIDQEKVEVRIREAIQNKTVFQSRHRVFSADGEVAWLFSRAVPIFDDLGEIKEWFGTASNITQSVQAEEALLLAKEVSEQQKRVHETIANSTPDLMYVFDLQYNFIYANEALLRMWGKTWDEAIGKGLLENGYEPWHAEMHHREIDQVRSTQESIRGEVSFPHAVLGKRIYDYIFTPIINETGEVEAIAGTTRDITEIRQNEQRKNDFIGMVSHELKTPITSLTAYLELLDKRNAEHPDLMTKKAIAQSIRQTRKMTSIINGFLNLARLESGKMFIEKALFDILELVSDLEEESRMLYPNHLFVFKPVESILVNADRGKINQVITNLLNNAVKYSELGSTIRISVSKTENLLHLKVEDEGIGMSENDISGLFERFYRGQNNKLVAGFGIGLYVCKEIIKGHKGNIWAESKVGKGSTFYFTLPLNNG